MEGTRREVRRRQAPRLPIQLAGTLLARTNRDITVQDLSLTGCLVRCHALLDHGAIFDLRLDFGDQPLQAKVQVTEAYLDGAAPAEGPPVYLAGLRFLSLPAQEAARLLRFLEAERQKRRAGPTAQ